VLVGFAGNPWITCESYVFFFLMKYTWSRVLEKKMLPCCFRNLCAGKWQGENCRGKAASIKWEWCLSRWEAVSCCLWWLFSCVCTMNSFLFWLWLQGHY
jgi:hypothetical protein